ncbi:MAG TPA: NAD(+) diphosphatase [Pseudomonadales bacterium]|jgi:NAD+ diphosphatase
MWPIYPDEFESLVQAPPGEEDDRDAWYFLCINGQIACVVDRGAPRPITADEFRWLDIEVFSKHYLGRFGNRPCFAMEGRGQLPPDGYLADSLYSWLGRVEPSVFYLAGRAQQVVEWHNTHQYCGRCGAEMQEHAADRAKTCGGCGLICYPRIAPSIIVLVTKGDEMLLARNARWPTGMYSTLAGFVEVGESIEQTVHREVYEEVGIQVDNLRYLGSQSWPFPNSLMLGFHADYAGGEIICNEEEIADAKWFAHDELPSVPPATAISRWLIDDFIEEVGRRSSG